MTLIDLPRICPDTHDFSSLVLSSVILVGLVISYLPQHLRIIHQGTSEGFSPVRRAAFRPDRDHALMRCSFAVQWSLLLGATSSASAFLNLVVLQWPVVRCCAVVSRGMCAENLLGLVQVGMQWFLFSVILVLYLVYFPVHLKYQRTLPLPDDPILARSDDRAADVAGEEANERAPLLSGNGSAGNRYDATPANGTAAAVQRGKAHVRIETTPEWRLAVTLAWVVFAHLLILVVFSVLIILSLPTSHPLVTSFTSLLSALATFLAIAQYAPQLVRTFRARTVGALSIGTMAIQVPGSVVFCASLAGRDGVRWDAWGVYAVTGLMQGALLVMCVLWKRRQKRLGIDDFGRPREAEGEGVPREYPRRSGAS